MGYFEESGYMRKNLSWKFNSARAECLHENLEKLTPVLNFELIKCHIFNVSTSFMIIGCNNTIMKTRKSWKIKNESFRSTVWHYDIFTKSMLDWYQEIIFLSWILMGKCHTLKTDFMQYYKRERPNLSWSISLFYFIIIIAIT